MQAQGLTGLTPNQHRGFFSFFAKFFSSKTSKKNLIWLVQPVH
jgi:hypothetical protein